MKTAQLTTTSVWEQEIIDAIGIDATLSLEKAFSPSYLYIGAKAPSKAIIEAIGLESALLLCEFFGCSVSGEKLSRPGPRGCQRNCRSYFLSFF